MGKLAWVAASTVLLLVPGAALAASTTLVYDTPGTWPIGFSCSGCADMNIGGVAFPPQRQRPQQVDVLDVREPAVGFVVCQDFDRDGNCGESHEPIVHACGGSVLLDGTVPKFRLDFWTTVFLEAVGTCPGVATSGTVTLTTW